MEQLLSTTEELELSIPAQTGSSKLIVASTVTILIKILHKQSHCVSLCMLTAQALE